MIDGKTYYLTNGTLITVTKGDQQLIEKFRQNKSKKHKRKKYLLEYVKRRNHLYP